MDLAQFETATGTLVCELEHPTTGEPLTDSEGNAVAIELLSPQSKKYKQMVHDQTNRRLKNASRRGGRVDLDAAQLERESLALLVKTTVGFRNLSYKGEVPKTPVEIRTMYEEQPWMVAQAEAFLNDERNFTKASDET